MSGSGQRAALPPAGYRRPGNLECGDLAVRCRSQAGQDLGLWDFSGSPGPVAFRREVVAVFARHVSPYGSWASAATCEGKAFALRAFLRFAAGCDPAVTRVEEITPAVWSRWLMGGHREYRNAVRPVLLGTAALPSATRELIEHRSPHRRPRIPQASYTRADFTLIRDTAAANVRAACLRIAANTELLERWRAGAASPGSTEERWGELLDHLARTGDLPLRRSPTRDEYLEPPLALRQLMADAGRAGALARLFPTFTEMGAAAVLLICHEGWNLGVVERMRVPAQWPNADAGAEMPVIHQVDTDKPRRGPRARHSSNNLVDWGEGSPGRAMLQVLKMTAQARATLAAGGHPSESLLLARRYRGRTSAGAFADGTSAQTAIREWSKAADLRVDGKVLQVGARTLRRTVQVLLGGPRGNTQRTHQDVYLMRDQQVRKDTEEVIISGLREAVEYAQARVRMRVIALAADSAPAGAGEMDAESLARGSGLSPEMAKDVMAGRLDTAVAACTDFEHSPFTPDGPCAVSFLLCFACPNAVATARHLPRIVYLQQALTALASSVSPAVWAIDWAGHLARITDLLHAHTSEAARPVLLAEIIEHDRDLIDRMLERRLDA